MAETLTLDVSGLTCGHCASHVKEELTELDEVIDVSVDLVVGGVSTVTVIAHTDLSGAVLRDAINEAGGYTLQGIHR